MYKILFPVSEAYLLIKTGGLADIASSLSIALHAHQCDVRLLLPAYQPVLDQVKSADIVTEFYVPESDAHIRILETTLPETDVIVWLVDHPASYLRPGNPYLDANGEPWPDNAARFALLSRVAAMIGLGNAGISWQPEVVHCHDWQTALAPALISLADRRPVTVFTIHNLAYQGLFDASLMDELHLPPEFWCPEGLEFYGQLSFIKGGLMYADHVTTVSPTYAREIQTPEFGCGLENALRLRADRLTGILNGIDDTVWDPETDPYLSVTFDRQRYTRKAPNKKALQTEANFRASTKVPVLSQVCRLVSQKGVDLVIGAIYQLLEKKVPFQFVSLGNGNPEFEEGLTELATNYPKQVYSMIGYDEVHAHHILAGSDMFLVPSRFEPCGLTQMYSLRYGAIPIVRNVGGLADTVVDANEVNLQAGRATGFVFEDATVEALVAAIERAMQMYEDRETWSRLVANAMAQDFSWRTSVDQYMHLYRSLIGMRT